MHKAVPSQRPDGSWEMIVKTFSPDIGTYSVCAQEEMVGSGKKKRKILRFCQGHADAMAARNCPHAKAWIRKIAMEGELVIERLRVETPPLGEDAVRVVETMQPQPTPEQSDG